MTNPQGSAPTVRDGWLFLLLALTLSSLIWSGLFFIDPANNPWAGGGSMSAAAGAFPGRGRGAQPAWPGFRAAPRRLAGVPRAPGQDPAAARQLLACGHRPRSAHPRRARRPPSGRGLWRATSARDAAAQRQSRAAPILSCHPTRGKRRPHPVSRPSRPARFPKNRSRVTRHRLTRGRAL